MTRPWQDRQDDIPAQSNRAMEEESGSTRCREYAVIVWGEKVLIISDICSANQNHDAGCCVLCLCRWLPRTLFMSIAGGVSWEEPISTLKEISGWWILGSGYVAGV